ncbi:hypothetical protein S7711_02683 [Stachybotrys chartarum IBT 7711]|uniref:Holocytochrome c-type synthase n=1 Tax=Stachybotrys chartarum (strain CBS 109288 / IBT 7711) TaxID=1280523 RepID=A0A084AYY9_STACB|nr:hypothetical protein S7711_02683 [Stachybotrys chartarum IBT 7711]KFA54393.1 hypothetical protein S40293_04338 [Stachybotrys chartarum IBT 40293]
MTDKTADACPVDHKTRDAWLAQARTSEATKLPASCPVDHSSAKPPPQSWTQAISSYLWTSSSPSAALPPPAVHARSNLDENRVISTIPRSSSGTACPVPHGASANAEVDTGSDAASGNWVYPSEKMFFEAMKRKGYDARETDMKTVVPIHNAVNERAWKEIQQWEKPYLEQSKCGGPKLESFANKMDRMTPTARFNTILGFSAPFDRHDWVIDRCGTRVDYVIDFYSGKPDGKGGPSFYLDVRPKLNTWEGVKMRALRLTGLS